MNCKVKTKDFESGHFWLINKIGYRPLMITLPMIAVHYERMKMDKQSIQHSDNSQKSSKNGFGSEESRCL